MTTLGLKAGWTVDAGVIPGSSMPEYRRTWFYNSQDYENDLHRPDPDNTEARFERLEKEAYAYAQAITDPRKVNWVRVEFVWF